MESTSPRRRLDWTDAWKITRGALIVAGGVFLTNLLEAVPSLDLGMYQPIAVALSASLLEAIRRYFRDYQKTV